MADEHKPDAIIFIPSIGDGWNDQSLEIIGRKVALSFDKCTIGSPPPTVEIKEATFRAGSTEKRYRVCHISCQEAEETPPTPGVDIYELPYSAKMIARYERLPLLGKLVMISWAVILNFPRLVRAFFSRERDDIQQADTPAAKLTLNDQIKCQRRGASFHKKAQLAILLLFYVCLCVYMVSLFGVALAVLSQPVKALAQSNSPTAQPLVQSNSSTAQPKESAAPVGQASVEWTISNILLAGASLVFLAITILAGITPNKITAFILNMATILLCTINYINHNFQRAHLTEEVSFLIDKIEDTRAYRRCHIIAFSFGSIIAIDTLFPAKGSHALFPAVKEIDTLITIASPFDTIRSFWPEFFTRREFVTEAIPKRWLNIYAPVDLLASNFRNDDEEADPDVSYIYKSRELLKNGPRPAKNCVFGARPSGFFELCLAMWLFNYTRYWDDSEPTDPGCLGPIIQDLYFRADPGH